MKRRRFLQATCAMTATALAAPDTDPRALIIDTHQHLWDPARINPPWLQGAAELIRSKHHLPEYREATAGLNVTAIYMEIDVAEADLDREAEEVIGLCRDPASGIAAATIGGRPDAPGFADYAKRHAASGKVRGVRRVLHGSTPAGYCLRPEFVAGIQGLGELGLHFDLCMRPTDLMDGAALAKQCPGTRFVLDHCGNGSVTGSTAELEGWKKSIGSLAALGNTICKISGVIAGLPKDMGTEALAPIVNHCLDSFGPDRVVFGGDWPVCLMGRPLRVWIDGLTEIISNRPAAEQLALWSGNARKFYRLEVA
jgi:L-fuconolactonase